MGSTEAYTFYGTQLEELTEDELWAKKPVPVEEQVATDKQGRRRFHGAFTGGFSAGYFNTVGSEEGWTPATFRSTRAEKEAKRQQRPEDFMDDEDQEVFGIAPKVLRARQEYKKATFAGHHGGPSSLEALLRPVRDTVGVLLLRRMGWRPGQGVGPRQTAAEKRRRRQVAGRTEEEDPDEPDDDLEGVTFAPDDLASLAVAPKTNTYGMGYVGLATPFSLFEPPKPVMNAAVGGVRGQAFGVGAFEREDDDIYATDDMSRYDFFLESANESRKRRNEEKRAEIEKKRRHGESKCLENFAEAKEKMATATFYPPPQIPKHFVPKHGVRQTRFSEQKPQVAQKLAERKGRHDLTAEERAVLVGEAERKTETLVQKPMPVLDFEVVPAELQLGQFNPFANNPEKLKRYQQYLTLRKMKQTDKLVCLQPVDMTEWEKNRERNEFEQAAVLFRPLAEQISDRFVSSSTLVGSEETPNQTQQTPVEESVKAAKLNMFGKMTRETAPWQPCALLCKRFNVPEPNSGVAASGSKKKAGFSVFDFLAAQPAEPPKVAEAEIPPDATSSQVKPEATESEPQLPQPLPQELPPPKPREVFTTEKMSVEDKMDLFKSVFLSSSEDEEEEEEPPPKEPPPKRKSSPARGVFKSLDLMAPRVERPKVAPAPPPQQQAEAPATRTDLYGPALPPPARAAVPVAAPAVESRAVAGWKEEQIKGRWVEKERSKKEKRHRDRSRSKSRERKSKKKHKKHKHRH